MFRKRGLSSAVNEVLIILVVIVIVGLVALLLLPGTGTRLTEKGDCSKLINDINFVDTPYTCFIEGEPSGKTATGFSVQIKGDSVIGFRLGLFADGRSDTIDVLPDKSLSNVRMIDGSYGTPIEVPSNAETRTYVARDAYERIDLYPILDGDNTCVAYKKSVEPRLCIDPGVKEQLGKDEGSAGGSCGDGVKDVDEECDTGDLGGATCSSLGLGTGSLSCDSSCHYTGCSGSAGSGGTGSGTEKCVISDAHWEIPEDRRSYWSLENVPAGEKVYLVVSGTNCAGQTISFKVEEHDPWSFEDSVKIQPKPVTFPLGTSETRGSWIAEWQPDDKFGDDENPPEYFFTATAALSKSKSQSLKEDGSLLKVTTCGDGKIDSYSGLVYDEQCDDADFADGDGCSSSCKVEHGWQCTGEPSTCTQECGDGICGLGETSSSCPADCIACGDSIKGPGEQCDGSDFGPFGKGSDATCREYDFFFSDGTLRCTSDCQIDTSGCGYCGDGTRQGPEFCDGSDFSYPGAPWATGQCRDFHDDEPLRKYLSGELLCTALCTVDPSACGYCGDGLLDPSGLEQCDDFGGSTCCTSSCQCTIPEDIEEICTQDGVDYCSCIVDMLASRCSSSECIPDKCLGTGGTGYTGN